MCFCYLAVWYCGKFGFTNCVGHDKVLFRELYTSKVALITYLFVPYNKVNFSFTNCVSHDKVLFRELCTSKVALVTYLFVSYNKANFTLEQAMKAQRGSRGIALFFL
jgi:hypothetical protein